MLYEVITHILILVIMWSVIGMAWNLLGGYCGQVSFGHAAFFGVGAYTAGILYNKAHVITSYSIHYTKLYDFVLCVTGIYGHIPDDLALFDTHDIDRSEIPSSYNFV